MYKIQIIKDRGTLTGKIGNIQLTSSSPVAVKTFDMGGNKLSGRLRKHWIETRVIGSVFSIHLSVSNLL